LLLALFDRAFERDWRLEYGVLCGCELRQRKIRHRRALRSATRLVRQRRGLTCVPGGEVTAAQRIKSARNSKEQVTVPRNQERGRTERMEGDTAVRRPGSGQCIADQLDCIRCRLDARLFAVVLYDYH